MRGLQHANKQQTAYRSCRKALNNLGKEKDRAASRRRKQQKKKVKK